MKYFLLSLISFTLIACVSPSKKVIKQASFDHRTPVSQIKITDHYQSSYRLEVNNQEKIYRELPFVGIVDFTETPDQTLIDKSVTRSLNQEQFEFRQQFHRNFFIQRRFLRVH